MMIVHRYPSRRTPGVRGFMAPAATVLFLLMSMAALVTFAALQNSTSTTRATQDYQASRTTVETAESAAERYWNTTNPVPAQPFASSWTSPQYTEGRTRYSFRTDVATKNVIATATTGAANEERTQTSTRPLRARVTGSWRKINGEVFYGVTANTPGTGAIENGAWGAAAITTGGGTSNFNGTIVPQSGQKPAWDAYGGTVANPGSSVRVAAYGPVTVTGSYASNVRSRLNAYLDKVELQGMWDDFVNAGCESNSWSRAEYVLTAAAYENYWCSSGSVDLAGTGNWAGVRTLMATGDVNFTGPVSTGGGQLHIYTKSNVNFIGAGNMSTLTIGNVFIFAPNGTCRVDRYTGPSLLLSGALACRRVDMVPNAPAAPPRITHVAPQPHQPDDPYGQVVTPDPVYYLERPDFLDRWN